MNPLLNEEFVNRSLSYTVSSVSTIVVEPFSVTLDFGAASAEKVVALDSSTTIIPVVFAQMFGIDVSMVAVSSVEAVFSIIGMCGRETTV